MLERGEELRRNIREDKESDGDDDGEDDDDDKDLLRIKTGMFEELSQLNKDDPDKVATDGQGKKSKTIFEMKFMQDTLACSQQQTDHMVNDFVKKMGGKEGEGWVEELDDKRTGDSNGPSIQQTGG
jgi:U3 small nucleolar RNA-associated protein 14